MFPRCCEAVLVWAALEGRVVLTHDVATLIARAYERVGAGQPMLGVIADSQATVLRQRLEERLGENPAAAALGSVDDALTVVDFDLELASAKVDVDAAQGDDLAPTQPRADRAAGTPAASLQPALSALAPAYRPRRPWLRVPPIPLNQAPRPVLFTIRSSIGSCTSDEPKTIPPP